jgi:hypothetical protein
MAKIISRTKKLINFSISPYGLFYTKQELKTKYASPNETPYEPDKVYMYKNYKPQFMLLNNLLTTNKKLKTIFKFMSVIFILTFVAVPISLLLPDPKPFSTLFYNWLCVYLTIMSIFGLLGIMLHVVDHDTDNENHTTPTKDWSKDWTDKNYENFF